MFKSLLQDGDLKRSPSLLILVLVNLFPLIGVIIWGWKVFDVIFLFWFENVIIGFYNILRMLSFKFKSAAGWLAKLFFVPFFTFHYGMFTGVHGMFVILLFNKEGVRPTDFPTPAVFLNILSSNNLSFAALLIFLSHGFSFIWNYLGKKEYDRISMQQLMFKPYKRIVILHLVIILSGFLVLALKQNIFAVLLLIMLKILADIRGHIRDHKFVRTPSPVLDAAEGKYD